MRYVKLKHLKPERKKKVRASHFVDHEKLSVSGNNGRTPLLTPNRLNSLPSIALPTPSQEP